MQKLESLIVSVLKNREFKGDPFRGYFSEEKFSARLKEILSNGNSI